MDFKTIKYIFNIINPLKVPQKRLARILIVKTDYYIIAIFDKTPVIVVLNIVKVKILLLHKIS